jgi:hypothetical protein
MRDSLRAGGHVLASSLLAVVVSASCASSGSIRQLRREDSGGAYQLEGDEAAARAALERSMQRHCGAGNYEVVPPADGGSALPREVAYRCLQAPSTVPATPAPSSGGGGSVY